MANLLTGIIATGKVSYATRYNLVVTSAASTVFTSVGTSARKTKGALVNMMQDNCDAILDIVGDGSVKWNTRSKSFTFTSDKGTFYAKFICA
jgi:hypothetical protein